MDISETIKRQRKKQTQIQEELANNICISKKTVSNGENNT